MSIEEKIAAITGGRANSLTITFNEHWACYSTVEEELRREYYATDDADAIAECINADAMWTVSYHPRTPTASIGAIGSTLDRSLDRMLEALEDEPCYDWRLRER